MLGRFKIDQFPMNYTILFVLQYHNMAHAMSLAQDNSHVKTCQNYNLQIVNMP